MILPDLQALTRRTFATLALAGLAAPRGVLAQDGPAATNGSDGAAPSWLRPMPLGPSLPFDDETVPALARALAAQTYVAPDKIAGAWADLSYDDYRRIGFDFARAPWLGQAAHIEFYPPGLYFTEPVEVSLVEDGAARQVLLDADAFDIPEDLSRLEAAEGLGFSGFRVIQERGADLGGEEYLVFQGASYFRGRGFGDVYGLSARGLAIDTAEPGGEEFPGFRRFWIERPGADGSVRIHALLDSPSVAGAYVFEARAGDVTQMDVTARLYPRRALAHVGIGAQTSMFLFDETNRARFDDFRRAVHDSDGLLVDNGAGERLWRPLANPRDLQVSQFVDQSPKGFGLMQRTRSLADFRDFEALYHRRPGLWVTPTDAWGTGSVTLVEIPSGKEIYDNVVAYWRPAAPLRAGDEHRFGYRLSWGAAPEPRADVAAIADTAMGERLTGPEMLAEGRRVVVDFRPHQRLAEGRELRPFVGIDRGSVSDAVLMRNPETGTLRLAFHFDPQDHPSVELRAQVLDQVGPASEVWLYRWTPPLDEARS